MMNYVKETKNDSEMIEERLLMNVLTYEENQLDNPLHHKEECITNPMNYLPIKRGFKHFV